MATIKCFGGVTINTTPEDLIRVMMFGQDECEGCGFCRVEVGDSILLLYRTQAAALHKQLGRALDIETIEDALAQHTA